MKIIQVINHFLPQKTAGSEIYTWALCKGLQKFGVDIKVITPNFNTTDENNYEYDGISVCQYPEPTIFNRAIALGLKTPFGLKNFETLLKIEKPDIVHFQEVTSGCGITKSHVLAAKNYGAKVLMTFHLANHTCITGTLVREGKTLCDGIIQLEKCSICSLKDKGFGNSSKLIYQSSNILKRWGISSINSNNCLTTSLGVVKVLEKYRGDFNSIADSCDKIVVITEWYKKMMIDNGIYSKKIQFIPQALPIAHNVKSEKSLENHTLIRLVYFGRISFIKGLNLLLNALKSFDSSKISLNIYGEAEDPKYEEILKEQTKEMPNILWMGKVKNEMVAEIMSRFDLLCLCSKFGEMSPLVIQEAYSVGIPVIASNIHGNSEQVIDGINGLLFERDNIDSLKQTISRIINQPQLLKTMKANVVPPRSFNDIAKEYMKLYNSLLND